MSAPVFVCLVCEVVEGGFVLGFEGEDTPFIIQGMHGKNSVKYIEQDMHRIKTEPVLIEMLFLRTLS